MLDFLSIKKSVEAVRARFFALAQQIEDVKSEARKVANAPLHRADIIAFVEDSFKRNAAAFDAVVAARVQRQFRDANSLPEQLPPMFFGLRHPEDAISGDNLMAMDALMCSVFADPIRAATVGAIERMEWPGDGLRMAERAKKLEALRAKERQLRDELEKISKEAEQAGIDLAPSVDPTPVRW